MQDKGGGSKTMAWVAAGGFLLICITPFKPARDLICSRYEVEGFERLLALLRGAETNCFWAFLYDFQTLITGLAAIVAGGLAVKATLITEQGNARRHQQTVALTLKSDLLRIEHLINPQIEDLIDVKTNFDIEIEKLKIDSSATLQVPKRIGESCKNLSIILDRPVWNDAKPMLDWAFVENFNDLREANTSLQYMLASTIQQFEVGGSAYLTRVCGDSQISANVIHALDGSFCADRRPMGEDRTALSGKSDGSRSQWKKQPAVH